MSTEALPSRAVLTDTFRFVAAMDNHQPVHRTEATGTLERWVWPDDGRVSYRIPGGVSTFKGGERGIYLIDDGRTVLPLYVAGWPGTHDRLFLEAMPVNVNEDGTPRMRADRDEQVDYSTWMHGPARAYHLKITQI